MNWQSQHQLHGRTEYSSSVLYGEAHCDKIKGGRSYPNVVLSYSNWYWYSHLLCVSRYTSCSSYCCFTVPRIYCWKDGNNTHISPIHIQCQKLGHEYSIQFHAQSSFQVLTSRPQCYLELQCGLFVVFLWLLFQHPIALVVVSIYFISLKPKWLETHHNFEG